MFEMFEKQIAEILLRIKAVKVSINPPFTWVSGIKSPVYCDNRLLISYPKERKIIVSAFKKIIEEKIAEGQMEKPEVLGGTATSAIPWAAFLAYEMNLPMIYIRPEKKGHGTGKQIEGALKPNQRVLIIEDLISTGGSSISAASAVREEGQSKVADILAIVTWELYQAEKNFKEAGLNLTALTNFTNLISLAVEKGQIKPEEYQKILEFKEDTEGWGKKMGFV